VKAWDIWTGDIFGPHPVVLVSCQARIDAKAQVVVLKCTTMQPATARAAKENETVLDEADGLNWKTLCRCDLLFTVPKASLTNRRGSVTGDRRRDIARKIIQGLAIAGL
jgi:mRNA-degrading endonuclease toxin of MazEF toxin-antitoxin module